jgi:alkanesulfonate monooxygenase SsuD/methylene tetrahydromethanopterin reductase-like flavin-dependent oxidoreductase (luciferase family)
MELGVVAWLTDLDLDIADLARMVEQAGLESLFMPEHTHVPVARRDLLEDPYHVHDPRLLDHVVALGAAAAVTSRLKLGTAACVLPQRDRSSWPSKSARSTTSPVVDSCSASPPVGLKRRCAITE